jgi:DNA-binding CsgD family transcriptional regulator
MVEEIGRLQWAGGDLDGAVRSMERALVLMPPEPSPERARAYASLAQHLMIDGRFAESARHAEEARRVAQLAGNAALPELGHATCTLGMDVAYLGQLDRGLGLLADSDAIARRAGRLDDLMRVAANRTTLLDLDARREEALAVVADGIREAEAGGLAGTYGAFLRGNAADILFQLGRWTESELECRAGMEWLPAGVAWFSPTLYLGLVLVESRADDEAASLVGQTMLQLDTVPAGQWSALVQRAAVSLALWRDNHADAVQVATREWPRVLETDDPVQVALGAATCMEAASAASERGRTERDIGLVSAAMALAEQVLPEAEVRVASGTLPPGIAARVEADLYLATARAHRSRLRGRPSPVAWGRIAQAWAERPIPYLAAKAHWWHALAVLQVGGSRDEARAAIREAWRIAAGLPARPLLRALADLASRARLPLPDRADQVAGLVAVPVAPRPMRAVGPGAQVASEVVAFTDSAPLVAEQTADARAGVVRIETGATVARPYRDVGAIGERVAPGDRSITATLSPRELEVLAIICEGRTDREIAERLFISERTVHVHVRRVLSKLGVTSRTQAAALAFRQGLVPATARGAEPH